MSQQPFQPIPYYTSAAYPVQGRVPGSVKAVAIIGIILGGLGACGSLSTIIKAMTGASDPVTANMTATPALLAFFWFSNIAAVVMLLMLIIGSIALLNLKPWGRTLMIAYAIIGLCMQAVSLVTGPLWVWPAATKAYGKLSAQGAEMAHMVFISAMVVATIIGIAWPLIILAVMTRPRVKAAFGGPLATPVTPLAPPLPEGYAAPQEPYPPPESR